MELNGVRDEEIWIFEVTRISFTERTERNISGNILSGSGYQVNGSKGEGEMWGPCVPPPFLLFFLMLLLFLSYLFSLVLLSLDRAERLPARQGAAAGRRARWWVAAHRLTGREAACGGGVMVTARRRSGVFILSVVIPQASLATRTSAIVVTVLASSSTALSAAADAAYLARPKRRSGAKCQLWRL